MAPGLQLGVQQQTTPIATPTAVRSLGIHVRVQGDSAKRPLTLTQFKSVGRTVF
jgi:hypothetical protein